MGQELTIQYLRTFLRDGGSPDMRLENNQPLLTRAVLTGEIELVQILLDAGAAVNPPWERVPTIAASRSDGVPPLLFRMDYVDAVFRSCGEDDQEYEQECDWIPEIETPKKIQSPLNAAAVIGNHQIVTVLLRSGAQPNLAYYSELWPIVIAAHQGDFDIVQTLLASGADASTPQYRPTALGVASYKGHIEIVRLLLKSQADPNIPTHEDGYTPLMRAATGHLEIVKMLIAAGADVNVWAAGDNALERAIVHAEREIYEFLLPFATEETRRLLGSDIEHQFQRATVQKQRLQNKAVRKLSDLAFAGKSNQLKLLIAAGVDITGSILGVIQH
jgi:ankyrin repeat protein